MRILSLFTLFTWAQFLCAEQKPSVVGNFGASHRGDVLDATTVFLSDESIALLVRYSAHVPEVLVFRLSEGNLQLIARKDTLLHADTIVAVSGNRPLIASHGREALLYTANLDQQRNVQMRPGLFLRPFPGSKIIGQNAPRLAGPWQLVELNPEVRVLRQGSGQLISVSDFAIAVRRENTVFFESPAGRPIGSVRVPPDTTDAAIGEIGGENRFFLDFGERHEIINFQGTTIRRISKPPGWGFRRGWSANGQRLLVDQYTRTASAAAAADRAIERLASAVVPVPEEANGELIQVIDTDANNNCFQLLRTRGKEFRLTGGKHADLSPNGQLAVVATLSTLEVYNLPGTCSK